MLKEGAYRWLRESTRRHPAVWPIALLLVLPILVFGPALLPGRVLSPADVLAPYYPWRAVLSPHPPGNPLLADQALQFHPWLLYAAREIRAGRLPLWNPHAYAGAPFLANAQSALFSPFTGLAYLLPIPLALGLMAIGKLLVAGLSTYWFLRLVGLGLFGATLGAVTFMFNGFLIVWLGHPHSAVAVWLPTLFAATEWLRQTRSRWALSALAVVIALQFLGGHPETSLHILTATGLYAVYRWRGPGARRFALQFGAAAVSGLLLAAIQLLPFYEYVLRSSTLFYRERLSSELAGSFPEPVVPSWAWITWLVPRFFGDPVNGNFWGPANYNEISGYAGIVPLTLLPFAALRSSPWWGVARFFWGLLALTPLAVYDLTRAPFWLAKLPAFSVSGNTRLILVISFTAAVLAAIGADRLVRMDPVSRRMGLVVKGTFVALLAAVGWRLWQDRFELLARDLVPYISYELLIFVGILAGAALLILRALRTRATNMTRIGLLALVSLDLARVAVPYNPVIARRAFYPSTPALEFLRRDPDLFRVLLPLPNLGALYGLYDVSGYDAMTPRRVEQLVDSSQSVGPFGGGILSFTEGMDSPLLDLLNVKYVFRPPGDILSARKFRLVYDGPDGRLYQNLEVFPRAFLVSETISCLDDARALALLKGGGLNLRRQVVVQTCDPLPAAAADSTGQATVTRYAPGAVRVRSNSSRPAVLVLADSYDPGWRVSVDGERRPLYRANYALRAVLVPAGVHEIEFRYRPWSVMAGAGISGVTAILLGVFVILRTSRGRVAAILLVAFFAMAGSAAAHTPSPLPAELLLETPNPTPGGVLRATIITSRGDPTPLVPDTQADLYVALRGPRRTLYLDQGGNWQPWPVPYRRAVPVSQIAGLQIVGPVDRSMTGAGFHTLEVRLVHPGRNLRNPHQWVAGPLKLPIGLAPAWSLTPVDGIWLAILASATLAAVFLVLLI